MSDWRVWLLLLIVVRYMFSFFGEPPVISPQFTNVDTLLEVAMSATDEKTQMLALQALEKSARRFPRQHQRIIDALEQHTKLSAPGKKTLQTLKNDPLLQIQRFIVSNKRSLVFYMEPLFRSVPIILLFLLALLFLFYYGDSLVERLFVKYSVSMAYCCSLC